MRRFMKQRSDRFASRRLLPSATKRSDSRPIARASICEPMECRLLMYSVFGSVANPEQWTGEVGMTYSYSNLELAALPLGDTTVAQIHAAVEEALSLWASVTPIRFREIADIGSDPSSSHVDGPADPNAANIRIGHHFIDGYLGEGAHAFAPGYSSSRTQLAGDVHFDNGDYWSVTNPANGAALLPVMVHEIGHALGLGHSDATSGVGNQYLVTPSTQNAIMRSVAGSPYFNLGSAFLYADDIQGMRYVYADNLGVTGNGNGTGFVRTLDGEIIIRGREALSGFESGDDNITLTQSGNNLTITGNGASRTIVDANNLSKITIYGRGGNDTIQLDNTVTIPATIDGGAGNDTLQGGAMNDFIAGEGGTDTIRGLDGGDVLYGGDGNDTLYGGNGADFLDAQFGNDDVYGDGGNDVIFADFGADDYWGGSGTDDVTYGARTEAVTVGIGTYADDGSSNDGPAGARDNVHTDVENLHGGSGNDSLSGSSAANSLTGGLGNDTLIGNDGNDIFYVRNNPADADIINGGNGTDSAMIDSLDTNRSSIETLLA